MRRAATAWRPHGRPAQAGPGRQIAQVVHGSAADGADDTRPYPARSLLGAGLAARLALVAGALALLWTTVLWALK
ncbi:MAG: hypothetical protein KUL79_07045 [Thauera sp.]|nr:hypothetical protein [Thauera sp.]